MLQFYGNVFDPCFNEYEHYLEAQANWYMSLDRASLEGFVDCANNGSTVEECFDQFPRVRGTHMLQQQKQLFRHVYTRCLQENSPRRFYLWNRIMKKTEMLEKMKITNDDGHKE